jgi:hypothetical protein
MKRNMLCAAMVLFAGSLLAADKDDVSAAIAKLASSDNYSWKSTTTNVPPPGGGGGGRGRGRGGFGGGPIEGKTQKDGLIAVTFAGRGDAPPTVGYLMNTNVAIQTDSGWQSYAEATADDGGGGFNPGAFTAIRVQGTKSPADEAKTLLDSAKSVTMADGAYTAVLNDDAAKARLQFGGFGGRGRRGGGGGGGGFQIAITDAKGTVKFWVKDGVLVKYEIKSTGNQAFGDNDPMPVDRTTTVEIKDIGASKIDLPADAKKKLS